jgi:hypothetical protein
VKPCISIFFFTTFAFERWFIQTIVGGPTFRRCVRTESATWDSKPLFHVKRAFLIWKRISPFHVERRLVIRRGQYAGLFAHRGAVLAEIKKSSRNQEINMFHEERAPVSSRFHVERRFQAICQYAGPLRINALLR